ncbi:MAG: TlpA disulfide reductase family protein [Rikenellaceae bacterium]
MNKGNKKLLLLVALLVVVGAVIILLPTESATQEAAVEEVVDDEAAKKEAELAASNLIVVGDDAPQFSVEMTNGETVTLESLRGKVVLLNFWATWCPPCREELTHVQADIIDRFADRDFVFLPISRGEEKATVVEFLDKNKYAFAAGLDTDQSIYKSYAHNYIPRNFLINRHGVVVEATIGFDEEEFAALQQLIEMTLNAR